MRPLRLRFSGWPKNWVLYKQDEPFEISAINQLDISHRLLSQWPNRNLMKNVVQSVDKFFVKPSVTGFYGNYQEVGRKTCSHFAGVRI
jgi:hypothetical protein